MMYVKISASDETNLSLHAESSYSQVDLKERKALTDVVQQKEINRYLITSVRNKEIIINIHILSGNIKVGVFDYYKLSVSK